VSRVFDLSGASRWKERLPHPALGHPPRQAGEGALAGAGEGVVPYGEAAKLKRRTGIMRRFTPRNDDFPVFSKLLIAE
jgi:hypothetical protein